MAGLPSQRPWQPRLAAILALGGGVVVVALLIAGLLGASAASQAPPTAIELDTPAARATGVPFRFTGSGAAPDERIGLERRRDGRWSEVASTSADANGRFRLTHLARPPSPESTFRVRQGDALSNTRIARTRAVTLAAVGDVNLGDRTADLVSSAGARAPWTGVAPTLRKADVAVGNLECAVSVRGAPVPKEFNFRGTPAALKATADFAGLDVVSLANNHAADYGKLALADTLVNARRSGLVAVGAGPNAKAAARAKTVERLGLKIAFLGFSDVNPAGFVAGPSSPGTAAATPGGVEAAARAAKRSADVVVVVFHWGEERATQPSARQQGLATAAVRGGAQVVIGAHPHVLQPIRRVRRTVVAYSLGNFVFAAFSPGTSSTGILGLELSAAGVEKASFRPGRIQGVRPVLTGPARTVPAAAG